VIVTALFLSPVHTVAEKCDCRQKRRDNGEIRRLSHFSATVWTGFYTELQHYCITVSLYSILYVAIAFIISLIKLTLMNEDVRYSFTKTLKYLRV